MINRQVSYLSPLTWWYCWFFFALNKMIEPMIENNRNDIKEKSKSEKKSLFDNKVKACVLVEAFYNFVLKL